MHNKSMTQKWVSKYGGPLLLLSKELLPLWEGSAAPTGGRIIEARFRWAGPGTPATDYDRACDIDDYLGLIEVGDSYGLVLGEEPLLTAWYPLDGSKQAGTLIRWVYADNEQAVLAATYRALSLASIWQTENFTFEVGSSPLCLFGATFAGVEIEADDCLDIELNPGAYSAATAIFEPDPSTSVVLHRLTLNV